MRPLTTSWVVFLPSFLILLGVLCQKGEGWIGRGELANSEPDGYTLGYIWSLQISLLVINPTANRKENLDSF